MLVLVIHSKGHRWLQTYQYANKYQYPSRLYDRLEFIYIDLVIGVASLFKYLSLVYMFLPPKPHLLAFKNCFRYSDRAKPFEGGDLIMAITIITGW